MLFKNAYSAIITNGMGAPACCALLTANFSLVCGCVFRVEVIGGGGYYPYHVVTPYYTPMRAPAQDTCLVLVDVKLGENHWRKSYVVDKGKGDTIITVINTINRVKTKFVGAVSAITRTARKVLVYFSRKDK